MVISVFSKSSYSNQESFIKLVMAVSIVLIGRERETRHSRYHPSALPSLCVSLVQRSSVPAGGVESAEVKTIDMVSRTADWQL